jgi:hypothetical protein
MERVGAPFFPGWLGRGFSSRPAFVPLLADIVTAPHSLGLVGNTEQAALWRLSSQSLGHVSGWLTTLGE